MDGYPKIDIILISLRLLANGQVECTWGGELKIRWTCLYEKCKVKVYQSVVKMERRLTWFSLCYPNLHFTIYCSSTSNTNINLAHLRHCNYVHITSAQIWLHQDQFWKFRGRNLLKFKHSIFSNVYGTFNENYDKCKERSFLV